MPLLNLRATNIVCGFVLTLPFLLAAQNPTGSELPTFRVESRLALIDVIPEYRKTQLHARALLTDLKREDFRVFDNKQEMPIASFDVGAVHGTRPLALWLIVQCPQGFPPGWASDFLRGNAPFLKPALAHLDTTDVVGVAHWCDNGDAAVDLEPGVDGDAAVASVEHLLGGKIIHGENRVGELAMQTLVRTLLDNVHKTEPERLPILLFLYGDHCATYPSEAENIIQSVLESSGMVFGISNGQWPYRPEEEMTNGQIAYLVHHYAAETGGEFYTTADPKLFSAALDYILSQLHLRYTIGFKPTLIDGRRHTLRVELTKEAQKQYQGAELRYRRVYVPVARSQTSR